MALEMQNFEALSPPVVKKITWWTLMYTNHCRAYIRAQFQGGTLTKKFQKMSVLPNF